MASRTRECASGPVGGAQPGFAGEYGRGGTVQAGRRWSVSRSVRGRADGSGLAVLSGVGGGERHHRRRSLDGPTFCLPPTWFGNSIAKSMQYSPRAVMAGSSSAPLRRLW
jgi:hypothetical protein